MRVHSSLPTTRVCCAAVDVAISSSTMLGAGPYTNIVRSYNVPYVIHLVLYNVPGEFSIVPNADDGVNFEVYYFMWPHDLTGTYINKC